MAASQIVAAVVEWCGALPLSSPPFTIVLFDANPAVIAGFVSALAYEASPGAGVVGGAMATAGPPAPVPPSVPTHQWSWNGPDTPPSPHSYVPYDYDQNQQLERAFADRAPSVTLVGDRAGVRNGLGYDVNLTTMEQISKKYGTRRRVKREPLPAGRYPPLYDVALASYQEQVRHW